MGTLIVVEGLDGSGKATQARLLCEALQKTGRKVMQVNFPHYESESSALVRMYLAGAFGDRPDDVNPYAASCFFTVDRFASYKMVWGDFYESGGIVIADRYATSNAVHQCSKLPREKWDEFLAWLFDFEYNKVAIPSPDCVIYLDVDIDVSQLLISKRYHGNNAKKDIHEKDVKYLSHSRDAAMYCAQRLGWEKICCCTDGTMRSIEAIHSDVFACVESYLSKK